MTGKGIKIRSTDFLFYLLFEKRYEIVPLCGNPWISPQVPDNLPVIDDQYLKEKKWNSHLTLFHILSWPTKKQWRFAII